MNAIALFVASAAYAGYAPLAPGTFGSAVGLIIYGLLRWTETTRFEAALIGVLFFVGTWAASRTERHLGRTDPGIVVIDEVVGMLIAVAFLPVSAIGAVIAFLVFRVLDIIKPFPAAQSERLHGGLGIMVDDVFAGLYAHLFMRLLAWMAPAWVLQ